MKTLYCTLVLVLMSGCSADRFLIGDRVIKSFPAIKYETVKLGPYASAWFVPCDNPRGTVIILPGYNTNKGYFTDFINLWNPNNFNVLLLDYRGFGDSGGKPSFAGLIDDTHFAIAYAKGKTPVVIVHSFSLGTMVLTRVATQVNITGCIFDSLASPDSLGPTSLVIPDDLRTRKWMPLVCCPKLFIHSYEDVVTSYKEAMYVYDHATQPKLFWTTDGQHVLMYQQRPYEYTRCVMNWVNQEVLK